MEPAVMSVAGVTDAPGVYPSGVRSQASCKEAEQEPDALWQALSTLQRPRYGIELIL